MRNATKRIENLIFFLLKLETVFEEIHKFLKIEFWGKEVSVYMLERSTASPHFKCSLSTFYV